MFKKTFYAIDRTVRILCLGLIFGYRYGIGPFLRPHCRFYPSCSSYAKTAIDRFGCIKGFYLMLKRLGRCHPFHPGGYDPCPLRPPGPPSTHLKEEHGY